MMIFSNSGADSELNLYLLGGAVLSHTRHVWRTLNISDCSKFSAENFDEIHLNQNSLSRAAPFFLLGGFHE